MQNSKLKIAVLGVGTAGLTSLSHLLSWVPNAEIYSIHDPNTPILGIGESTTVSIPDNLYIGTGFNLLEDGHELDATPKFGVKYVGWRDHDFHSLIIPPSQAIHFNNFKLKDFCFKRFEQRWGYKFKVIMVKVEAVDREVDYWDQPLVSTFGKGIVCFFAKMIDGILHFLVQAKVEPGNYDVVELTSTIQFNPNDNKKDDFLKNDLVFRKYLSAKEDSVKFRTINSEEGGRFFRDENEYSLIEFNEDELQDIPSNYIWMTLGQMKSFLRYNNIFTNEVRSLIAQLTVPPIKL